jgi:hypothetical protein
MAMNDQHEVLSPWAEIDPMPLHRISPRLTDLEGKKIGLFLNNKRAARPMIDLVEQKLRERFPTLEFTRFLRTPNISMAESENWDKYREWLEGVDAVIFSHGD